jgi:GT2 family glycosyltransferase
MALRIAIGIATIGRPAILHATLGHIAAQTRKADQLVICPGAPSDLPDGAIPENATILYGRKGLTSQRNLIIAAAAEADILLFLDDDFFVAPNYLAELETLFNAHPRIVLATGLVVADGITSAGIAPDEADSILRNLAAAADTGPAPIYNAYGCNMAIRLAPVRAHAITFDENLPLYGWLEDVDFSRRLAPHGEIVKSRLLRGVHLGAKGGRNSGLKFGYSQIANPLYMARRRSLSPRRALAQIARNLAMNLLKSKSPEPWIDRAGRLAGNRLALADLAHGRLAPQRILTLD